MIKKKEEEEEEKKKKKTALKIISFCQKVSLQGICFDVSFITNTTISDLFLLLCYYFST